MLRKVEKLSWIHMRVRELSRGQTDTQTHMQTVDTRGDDNIRSVSVQRRRLKKHRTANERSTVHTANKVEFDSLSRSTLSPKLNMFNSVDFVESQCFLSNVFLPQCRTTLSNSTKSTVSNSTSSPVCTGLNGPQVSARDIISA